MANWGGYGTCHKCNKGTYRTRKEAKKHARARHPNQSLNAYPCPFMKGYHYGSLPEGGREEARKIMAYRVMREDAI